MKHKKFLCNENIGSLSKEDLQRIEVNAESAIEQLLDALEIGWRYDHNQKETPQRVAKMLVHETFSGRYYPLPKITDFPNASNVDQLITVGPIDVKSTCAHHLQPIRGDAYIGILPKPRGRIIGLSKFNRIVDHFARRPQIQEELTSQIANYLEQVLNPSGLIVFIKANHFCVCARGVNQKSLTTTIIAKGTLRTSPSLKSEFFQSITMKI
jgi:GTP cyclohydrolase I